MIILPLATSMPMADAAKIAVLGFCLVLIVLAVLAIFVKILSTIFGSKNTKKVKEEKPSKAEASPASPIPEAVVTPVAEVKSSTNEPVYNGYVRLENVSEQDAAVIMAITSHKLGIPLERLGFCSIKLQAPELVNISDQDAAAVMAITSAKTEIPLENLYFKSIKLMED